VTTGDIIGSGALPEYLVAMWRRRPLDGATVVPGSTPVVAATNTGPGASTPLGGAVTRMMRQLARPVPAPGL